MDSAGREAWRRYACTALNGGGGWGRAAEAADQMVAAEDERFGAGDVLVKAANAAYDELLVRAEAHRKANVALVSRVVRLERERDEARAQEARHARRVAELEDELRALRCSAEIEEEVRSLRVQLAERANGSAADAEENER